MQAFILPRLQALHALNLPRARIGVKARWPGFAARDGYGVMRDYERCGFAIKKGA